MGWCGLEVAQGNEDVYTVTLRHFQGCCPCGVPHYVFGGALIRGLSSQAFENGLATRGESDLSRLASWSHTLPQEMQLLQQRYDDALDDALAKGEVFEVDVWVGEALHAVLDGVAKGEGEVPLLLLDPPLERLQISRLVGERVGTHVLAAPQVLDPAAGPDLQENPG